MQLCDGSSRGEEGGREKVGGRAEGGREGHKEGARGRTEGERRGAGGARGLRTDSEGIIAWVKMNG